MTRRRLATSGLVAFVALTVVVAGNLLLGTSRQPSFAGPPAYVDETATAGIDHAYGGDFRFVVGGGVAAFDCDGDGRAEVYLAGGEAPAALYRNESPIGGALRFSPIPSAVTDLSNVNGAYPLDVDGDGHVDVAVLRSGESQLLRGLGDCRFEPAGDRWGLAPIAGQTEAFSATWEGEGLPTLAFGNYLQLDESGQPGVDCDDNRLVRPDASGARYGPVTALAPGYCALSMLFSDWDRSGRRDLRVSNDRQYYDFVNGEEQLWRIAPGEAPRRYTADDGWVQMQIWGMGIASQDLTGDGYPEVFLTSQGDNKLQTLTSGAAQPTYRDIALRRGAIATRPFTGGDVLPSTAWHPQFEDVNNDQFTDLFISKGNVNAQPGYATRDPSNLLLGQPDGTFVEAADKSDILAFDRGRGAALVDLNVDGLLDLVLVNYGADVRLWRNVGAGTADQPVPQGHWMQLRVAQPGANRDAIGAWLEIRIGDLTTTRELTIGGGHVGGQLGWIHVGLGPADHAEVRVQWPDGEVGPWLRVEADTFAFIERGASAARSWSPEEP